MNLEKVKERFTNNIHRHGLGAALHDVECLALNRLTNFEVLKGMVVELSDLTDPQAFEAPGFEGRFLSPAELRRFTGTHELDAPFLEDATRRGDRCHAMFEGDALAAYGWYAGGPTAIDEHFLLHFDPAYTYMYKGYTVPAYRGKRLHAVGMSRALRAFTEEGQRGLLSYVLSNNFASLKSTARMGYRTFGEVYLARWGGRSFAHASRGCRPYGFRVEALPVPPFSVELPARR